MLALLTWLAGTVGLGYLVVHYHLWHDMIAVSGDLVFIAWVLLGAAWLSRGMRVAGVDRKDATEWAKAIHDAQRREEAARKERESVGK